MTVKPELKQDAPQKEMKIYVSPELEYTYRDIFNIFVGVGDVVIEFGNRHRSFPDHVSISNRIVLSVSNAFNLQQSLQKALQDAQELIQQQLRESQEKGG